MSQMVAQSNPVFLSDPRNEFMEEAEMEWAAPSFHLGTALGRKTSLSITEEEEDGTICGRGFLRPSPSSVALEVQRKTHRLSAPSSV